MIKVKSYINGKELHSFDSIAEAARVMRVDESTIRKVLDTDTEVRSMQWKKAIHVANKSSFNRGLCATLGILGLATSISMCITYFDKPAFVVFVSLSIICTGIIYLSWKSK